MYLIYEDTIRDLKIFDKIRVSGSKIIIEDDDCIIFNNETEARKVYEAMVKCLIENKNVITIDYKYNTENNQSNQETSWCEIFSKRKAEKEIYIKIY